MHTLPHIIVVAGPTSSGKSDFAVDLALTCNGEIISADSRQIYRGLDIGTGKITKEEMKGIPHHLLDICDINESFSVVDFRDRALACIKDSISRGKTPILCGGTGYYIDAVLFTNTLPEKKVHSLEDSLRSFSNEQLYAMIVEKDTARAQTIDKHNRIRLVRALELIEAHGKVPILAKPSPRFEVTFYLLNPEKSILEDRVHKRLLKRFDQGMIKEMETLIQQGYDIHTLAQRGIEYKWMALYLQKEISYEELIEKLRIATWQYAKRQRTWNKKYQNLFPNIHIISPAS